MEQGDLHAGCEDTALCVVDRTQEPRAPRALHGQELIADILCLRCLEAFTKSSSVE